MKMQRLFIVVLALGLVSSVAAPGYAGAEADAGELPDVSPCRGSKYQRSGRADVNR